ncbi:hypothetical protein LTR49_025212 [Elasticomyces elasticus]|nr:hypothetical protein LTR49_025212 [Elasticomyces elasticus]
MDVAHPSSPRYGQHWTAEAVRAKFAPAPESIRAVRAWLSASGVDGGRVQETNNKGWLAIDLPVHVAESLLRTEYHEYDQDQDGTVRLGCDGYHLPQTLAKHVDFVKPGITLTPPLRKKTLKRDGSTASYGGRHHYGNPWNPHSNPPFFRPPYRGPHHLPPNSNQLPPELQTCNYNITPTCIRALYHIPNLTLTHPVNSLGVYGQSPGFSQEDLDEFFAAFAPKVTKSAAGTEANIDLDLAMSLVYPQTVTLYLFGTITVNYTDAEVEDTVTFLDPFLDSNDGSFRTSAEQSAGLACGTLELTRVTSFSYDGDEVSIAGQPVQERTCNKIMKLGLQGHTFVVSSGDNGVGGVQPNAGENGCIASDLSSLTNGTVFSPTFPAKCPYVLAVGATQLDDQTVLGSESVWDFYQEAIDLGGASGGSAGDYQKAAVSGYLNSYVPDYPSYTYNGIDTFNNGSNIGTGGGLYNPAGRGIPDVSADGASLTLFVNGREQNTFGTSLAAQSGVRS